MSIDNIELSPEECEFVRQQRREGRSYVDIADDVAHVTSPVQLIPHTVGDIESDANEPPVDDSPVEDTDLVWYVLEVEDMLYETAAEWLNCHPETVRRADPRDTPDSLFRRTLDSMQADSDSADDSVFESTPVTIPIEDGTPSSQTEANTAPTESTPEISEKIVNPEPGETVTLRDSGETDVVEWVDTDTEHTELVLENHPGTVRKRDLVEYSRKFDEDE